MEIKNRKTFNSLVKNLTLEVFKDELEEMTATGDVEGYDTPFAFQGKNDKKKNKKISTNSTGYSVVNEKLDNSDIKQIKKLVRDVISNVLRDIWLKLTTWK